MESNKYNNFFYECHSDESRKSARELIPILLSFYKPNSVIDIGCGLGTWLAEFQQQGIQDIQGVDGDYINLASLQVSPNYFCSTDLNQDFSKLFKNKFDLAISLEVAEHIRPENSKQFIKSLVSLSDVILFSAALPYQGGTGHINENWLEYWATLFSNYNYVAIDCLRPKIWNNENICWWYKQNTLLFVSQEKVTNLFPDYYNDNQEFYPLSYVHPEFLLWVYNRNRFRNQFELDVAYYRQSINFLKNKDSKSKLFLLDKIKYENTYNVRFNSTVIKLKKAIFKQLNRFYLILKGAKI